MNPLTFLFALLSPLCFSITNHIDRHLLGTYFKEGGVGTLILISSFFGIVVPPIAYWLDPTVLEVVWNGHQIEWYTVMQLAAVGFLDVLIVWFYLFAIKNDEASVVVVYYQLVPVLTSVLGYLILGEVISMDQGIAGLTILVGTAIISFHFDGDGKFKLRTRTILYMFAASLAWALQVVLFKGVALEENVLRSLFWEHIAMVLVALLIFIFIPSYRRHLMIALRSNTKKVLVYNGLNEIIYLAGCTVESFAIMMAPAGLILLSQPFQSFFVLVIGAVLLLEKNSWKVLAHKSLAIAVTGYGTYLLISATPS